MRACSSLIAHRRWRITSKVTGSSPPEVAGGGLEAACVLTGAPRLPRALSLWTV
jgi:hypothetical protein